MYFVQDGMSLPAPAGHAPALQTATYNASRYDLRKVLYQLFRRRSGLSGADICRYAVGTETNNAVQKTDFTLLVSSAEKGMVNS